MKICNIPAIASKLIGLNEEKLVTELQIPAKASEYELGGFKYQPDQGISIQRQSAMDAWTEISQIRTLAVERIGKNWGLLNQN